MKDVVKTVAVIFLILLACMLLDYSCKMKLDRNYGKNGKTENNNVVFVDKEIKGVVNRYVFEGHEYIQFMNHSYSIIHSPECAKCHEARNP